MGRYDELSRKSIEERAASHITAGTDSASKQLIMQARAQLASMDPDLPQSRSARSDNATMAELLQLQKLRLDEHKQRLAEQQKTQIARLRLQQKLKEEHAANQALRRKEILSQSEKAKRQTNIIKTTNESTLQPMLATATQLALVGAIGSGVGATSLLGKAGARGVANRLGGRVGTKQVQELAATQQELVNVGLGRAHQAVLKNGQVQVVPVAGAVGKGGALGAKRLSRKLETQEKIQRELEGKLAKANNERIAAIQAKREAEQLADSYAKNLGDAGDQLLRKELEKLQKVQEVRETFGIADNTGVMSPDNILAKELNEILVGAPKVLPPTQQNIINALSLDLRKYNPEGTQGLDEIGKFRSYYDAEGKIVGGSPIVRSQLARIKSFVEQKLEKSSSLAGPEIILPDSTIDAITKGIIPVPVQRGVRFNRQQTVSEIDHKLRELRATAWQHYNANTTIQTSPQYHKAIARINAILDELYTGNLFDPAFMQFMQKTHSPIQFSKIGRSRMWLFSNVKKDFTGKSREEIARMRITADTSPGDARVIQNARGTRPDAQQAVPAERRAGSKAVNATAIGAGVAGTLAAGIYAKPMLARSLARRKLGDIARNDVIGAAVNRIVDKHQNSILAHEFLPSFLTANAKHTNLLNKIDAKTKMRLHRMIDDSIREELGPGSAYVLRTAPDTLKIPSHVQPHTVVNNIVSRLINKLEADPEFKPVGAGMRDIWAKKNVAVSDFADTIADEVSRKTGTVSMTDEVSSLAARTRSGDIVFQGDPGMLAPAHVGVIQKGAGTALPDGMAPHPTDTYIMQFQGINNAQNVPIAGLKFRDIEAWSQSVVKKQGAIILRPPANASIDMQKVAAEFAREVSSGKLAAVPSGSSAIKSYIANTAANQPTFKVNYTNCVTAVHTALVSSGYKSSLKVGTIFPEQLFAQLRKEGWQTVYVSPTNIDVARKATRGAVSRELTSGPIHHLAKLSGKLRV